MAGQVNLSDIAEAIGISPATVSKALNGWPDISPDTRQRVLRTARRLDYPLDRLRRRGRKPKSSRIRRIGMVCFDHSRDEMLANNAYQKLIAGIEEEAVEARDELITEFGVPELPRCYLDMRVDAIVVIGRPAAATVNALRGLPVVCAPNHVPGAQCDVVLQDSKGGAVKVTRLLIDRGHREIAFVSHSEDIGPFLDRREGYEQAMRRANLEPIIITDARALYDEDCCDNLASRVRSSGATAIVAGNDFCACGMIRILAEAGIRVPQDISIVGFDNTVSHPGPYPWPALTTIDGNMRQVGHEVIHVLNQIRLDAERNPIQVTVACKLVQGQSVDTPCQDS